MKNKKQKRIALILKKVYNVIYTYSIFNPQWTMEENNWLLWKFWLIVIFSAHGMRCAVAFWSYCFKKVFKFSNSNHFSSNWMVKS
jgi:hypothetical protein